jgi:hypothetical protein
VAFAVDLFCVEFELTALLLAVLSLPPDWFNPRDTLSAAFLVEFARSVFTSLVAFVAAFLVA